MTGTTVRLAATSHEVRAGAALYQAHLHDELGVPRSLRYHWDLLEPERTYLEEGGPAGSAMLVAVTPDDQVVGVVALRRSPPPALAPEWYTARHPDRAAALELSRLAVHPGHRRRGLASRLVAAAIDHARTMHQPGVLHLHAHTGNPTAIGFWTASGAREVPEPERTDCDYRLADTAWFEIDVPA